ncbi:hypothetical protein PtrSN002B_011811 [Pyrenophora tritici-repentis]|nr:hypothetical protein PtrSN002B_011811 [Pyrenophora tritici-repentis]PWO22407.1 chitobiosyldiphosphodolichol beta-mannosyltransferase [Pyrenophora tritici-repentis]PZC91204.1 hypothetical protein A1F95_08925 [Pyrenophora tritici-repentis]
MGITRTDTLLNVPNKIVDRKATRFLDAPLGSLFSSGSFKCPSGATIFNWLSATVDVKKVGSQTIVTWSPIPGAGTITGTAIAGNNEVVVNQSITTKEVFKHYTEGDCIYRPSSTFVAHVDLQKMQDQRRIFTGYGM